MVLHLHYKYMRKKIFLPAPSAIIFSLEGVFATIAALNYINFAKKFGLIADYFRPSSWYK